MFLLVFMIRGYELCKNRSVVDSILLYNTGSFLVNLTG